MTDPAHTQADWRVRFEWGLAGARALVRPGDVAVVVDVLSFTTAVSVAVERGVTVLPYRWRDASAAQYAAAHGAALAVSRDEARDAPGATVSLAPGSLRRAVEVERVVLPSPNGSTISHELAAAGATVVAGCLRNAGAVARWAAGRRVLVVAAGERWPDGSLRPAAEDLWGAGAVLHALGGDLSPEAQVARDAYRAVAADLPARLRTVASALELIARGHGEDVAIAAEVDACEAVPLLGAGGFTAA